jgi:hypothetical protein
MGDVVLYMLVKEGGIPPSELGVNMKDPNWALRYLRVIGYIKRKEKDAMKSGSAVSNGSSLEYHISDEELAKL